jgi:peptide/nickel transport system substrate-binding protein
MRHLLVKLLILSFLAVVLTVGTSGQSIAQAPSSLVVAESVDLTTTDPQKGTVVTTESVLANIYDRLVNRDAHLRLKPGLALSWRAVSPVTWDFTLRRGVKFHNGERFNAETVKFSFDRGLDPKTKWSRAGAMSPIKSVTVVDEFTVRITTERPWSVLVQALARHGWIVPREHIQRNGDEALIRQPIGTGPYKFIRWAKDDRLELEANPEYWGGKPPIERVTIRVIGNDSTRLAELLAGRVHLNRRIVPEHYGPIERSTRAELVDGPTLSSNAINFILKDKTRGHPLLDKRVRQALNHAVNKQLMLETLLRGKGAPLSTFCNEAMFGCDTSITSYPYDPDRARALLREAGYTSGFDITFVTTEGRYVGDRDLTLAVVDQLAAVGVRVRPAIMESGLWLKGILERSLPYDATFMPSSGLLGHAGYDIARQVYHGQGFISFWINKEFDDLLDNAEASVDETMARNLLRRAQVFFKDEAPAIPLFQLPNLVGAQKGLEHTPAADGMLRLIDTAWKRR